MQFLDNLREGIAEMPKTAKWGFVAGAVVGIAVLMATGSVNGAIDAGFLSMKMAMASVMIVGGAMAGMYGGNVVGQMIEKKYDIDIDGVDNTLEYRPTEKTVCAGSPEMESHFSHREAILRSRLQQKALALQKAGASK